MSARRCSRAAAAIAAWTAMLSMASPTSAQVGALQVNSARDCALCHIAWVDSFKRPGAILLIDHPPESAVSASPTCLGCHDGGVGDDRRRVWMEHGHQTGMAPSPGMTVPSTLPLLDGKIACRTCHTAHSGSGPETLATTVFVRVQNDAGQLCVMCHSDYVKGPDQGSHPLGPMKHKLPDLLRAAGAHAGHDGNILNCQSCHTPHGQRDEHLMVLSVQQNQLCVSCHEQIDPRLWGSAGVHEHPQNAPLSSDAQRQAIRDMHTRTSESGSLICLSCHKVHHALPGRNILADTLQDSTLCARCHPGYTSVVKSEHDLRTSAPDARNLRGQTASVSGPCGACHGVHHAARERVPDAADPGGTCITCHREGQCAERKPGLPVSHPIHARTNELPEALRRVLPPAGANADQHTIACQTCHNPHETKHHDFLRTAPDALCSTCHADQSPVFHGEHNLAAHPELKNARGVTAAEAGTCNFCHGVHNAPGPVLWVATKDTPQGPNDLCVACHQPDGMAGHKLAGELRHPAGPDTSEAARRIGGHVPLFDSRARPSRDGFVACSSCHDTHAGKTSGDALLRLADAGPAGLCMECHEDVRPLVRSLHSQTVLREHLASGFDLSSTACAPCHAAHARPGMPPEGMWSGPLGPSNRPPEQRYCLGCHSAEGGARQVRIVDHPAVPMQNVAASGTPGYMPLLDDAGNPGDAGRVSCVTCHLPHGREHGAGFPDIDPASTSLRELQALRPMLRPYEAPNICSGCHGFDGLRRFLYWHRPQRRAGS